MDVRILGEFELLQDGRRVDMGTPRQRAVLARLLINPGETVSLDRLVDDLWPGDVPDSARDTIHVYLSKLRSALGDSRERLERRGSGYCFRVDPEELDAARFTQLATEGRAAIDRGDAAGARSVLGEALHLWRGPVLADLASEPFVWAEAARLEEIRLVALEHRIAADLELGNHGSLIEELGELVDRYPFRERFWEQLMLALYRSGRQAEALRAFEDARVQLIEELGLDPGPDLRRLADAILNQDTSLDLPQDFVSSRTAAVPRYRTRFVGRERELALGSELISSTRLLTLTGPPGSGKTRLASELAIQAADRFRHGVFFVDLAAVTDVGLVASTIAKDLGLRDAPGETPIESVAAYLRDRQALLVLDNFEQVLEAASIVGGFLNSAPEITIMVTSRSALKISGEQELPIAPLAFPAIDSSLPPSEVKSYDAVALFEDRARASDPDFTVGIDNADEVAQITARLDGLPLAIELAAARMRLLTPSDLLVRLREHQPALAEGPSDVAGRHRTLSDAIAWSYDTLEPREQSLFRRLGVFRGFTLDAATAVSDGRDIVIFGVDSLHSRSLIYRSDGGVGQTRFAMLETIRDFALEQLGRDGEFDEFRERHANYFLGRAGEWEVELTRDDAQPVAQQISAEIDNIRNVLQYAIDHSDPDLGLRLAGCIWRYFQSTGRLVEGRRWLESLLAAPEATPAARAKGLVGLAGLAYWQGSHGEAAILYEEAMKAYRVVGDPFEEADALYGLSMAVTLTGDFERGEHLAGEARTMFEQLGSREKIGQVYMAQAGAMHAQGRHSEARPLWEAALGIARELGDRQLAVTELMGIGICEYHDGNTRNALRIALESLNEAAVLENVQVAVWLLDYVAAFSVSASPKEAVRVAGAVDALRRRTGGGLGLDMMDIENARTAASRRLSQDEIHEAWIEGRAMTLDQAVDYAQRFAQIVTATREAPSPN